MSLANGRNQNLKAFCAPRVLIVEPGSPNTCLSDESDGPALAIDISRDTPELLG
jgi:hypothetical protein